MHSVILFRYSSSFLSINQGKFGCSVLPDLQDLLWPNCFLSESKDTCRVTRWSSGHWPSFGKDPFLFHCSAHNNRQTFSFDLANRIVVIMIPKVMESLRKFIFVVSGVFRVVTNSHFPLDMMSALQCYQSVSCRERSAVCRDKNKMLYVLPASFCMAYQHHCYMTYQHQRCMAYQYHCCPLSHSSLLLSLFENYICCIQYITLKIEKVGCDLR